KRVDEMGLRDQVVTTGLVPQHRVGAMMRAMDVLLHPSYREGLPRTVPQALLCGVPVCASETDGTPEACIDPDVNAAKSTGRVFPVGDTDAIREAVLWMFSNPRERLRMGQRGRMMCSTMFSAEAMVKGLEKVYADAIELAERSG
ncbi:MAG: glycosyltransferase family 4 protein, partial [bacterium]|nr:glycosyltransferase family 4 protein [bacterium]